MGCGDEFDVKYDDATRSSHVLLCKLKEIQCQYKPKIEKDPLLCKNHAVIKGFSRSRVEDIRKRETTQ
ncbi:MAG: hypothetical protein CMO61_13255 [Verrucomicrobiales bacterium]|nr:hypothetical protein [Verrucomicrobiales bacterium]